MRDASDLVTLLDCALSGEARGKRCGYPVTTASEIGWRSAEFVKLEANREFDDNSTGQGKQSTELKNKKFTMSLSLLKMP